MMVSKAKRSVKKTQSIVAYVALFAVAVVVLLLMSTYVRNSLIGRMKTAGDTFGQGEVYEYGVTAE